MDADKKQQIVKRLLLAHSAWYDVSEDYAFEGRTFDGYGEFHSYGERYVLTRRAKLWEVDTHDYLFILSVPNLTPDLLADLVSFMKEKALLKVEPKKDHMSSNLTLVVVCDHVDEQAARQLRRIRFRKNFKFGLEGWSDLRLAAIDLSSRGVFTNGAASNMRRTLAANAAIG